MTLCLYVVRRNTQQFDSSLDTIPISITVFFFLTRSIRRNVTDIGSRFYASVQHNDPTSASHCTGPNLCNGVTAVMEGNRYAVTPIRTKRPRFVRVFVFLFFLPPPSARFLPVHFWSIFRTTRNLIQTMGEGDSISGIYISLSNTNRSHNTLCECVCMCALSHWTSLRP